MDEASLATVNQPNEAQPTTAAGLPERVPDMAPGPLLEYQDDLAVLGRVAERLKEL